MLSECFYRHQSLPPDRSNSFLLLQSVTVAAEGSDSPPKDKPLCSSITRHSASLVAHVSQQESWALSAPVLPECKSEALTVLPHTIDTKITDTAWQRSMKENSLCPGIVQTKRGEQHQNQWITIQHNDCRRGNLCVAHIHKQRSNYLEFL